MRPSRAGSSPAQASSVRIAASACSREGLSLAMGSPATPVSSSGTGIVLQRLGATKMRSRCRLRMPSDVACYQRYCVCPVTGACSSSPVPVGIARQGAFDVMPAVAHGAARVVPGQARVGARGFPVAAQFRLDFLERPAAIHRVVVVAVLVRRLVVAPLAAVDVVRRVLVFL